MPKKTIDEIKKSFIEIHGEKYNYDKFNEYTGIDNKIIIICPQHGQFEQTPYNHLRSNGCKLCSHKIISQKLMSTKEIFIDKAIKKHNNFYQYEQVNYISSRVKVIITCPIHSNFEQTPNNHLQGNGCPICKLNNLRKTKISNKEDFCIKANKKHNNLYIYDFVNYEGNNIKVDIICKIHGTFSQKPGSHLQGNGCPKCMPEKMKQTCLKKYGVAHPSQNKNIMNKISNNSYKIKDYILPSGNIVKVQGYEHYAYNELLNIEKINEKDIINGVKNVPEIWYKKDNKERIHYVDIYIPSQKRCIEVKSTWTSEKKNDNIFIKQQAGKELGYIYEIWIYNGKGEKVKCYK